MTVTFETIAAMRAKVAAWKADRVSVGLVPTMGGLHAGHVALIDASVAACDKTIVTIFVNPTQFGANEDLDNYPSDRQTDLETLSTAGADAAFVPSVGEMYPDGFATRVIVDGLTDCLCGASRPGHMDGVTQVVSKLLNQAQADRAYFGEKDWQQLAVIRRMARDLDIPTEIVEVPTVRDEFGLALSSRNSYLDTVQIEVARKFNVILRKAAYDIAAGGAPAEECAKAAEAILAAGFEKIDYVECRDSESLAAVEALSERPARIFAAAFLGPARLIDNHAVV
ncbi:MAG: pantoate--beta-alanine ligase [Pseudomonadota bacterium]